VSTLRPRAAGRRPLAGIRVVDFTTLLPGPLATLLLAEAGARVTKVERPGGEDMRRLGPRLNGSDSAVFALLNRGKRSITLDLAAPAGARRALALIARADVLVEQYRPGVMARLGLGYEQLRRKFPRLIYCSLTGYGQRGARAQLAAHDLNYLADTGLLANVAAADGRPALPAAQIADIGGGTLPAVINILLALRRRDATGRGCHLDIAMADSLLSFQVFSLAEQLAGARPAPANGGLLTGGSPRYGIYEAGDGRWLALGALEDRFWTVFCERFGLPAALRNDASDPAATARAVARLFRRKPAAHWLRHFAGFDVCLSLVRTFDETLAGPEFRARGLWQWRLTEHAGTTLPALPVPIQAQFRAKPGRRARRGAHA
jgi:alpha-methylacyl-CoA racemase